MAISHRSEEQESLKSVAGCLYDNCVLCCCLIVTNSGRRGMRVVAKEFLEVVHEMLNAVRSVAAMI